MKEKTRIHNKNKTQVEFKLAIRTSLSHIVLSPVLFLVYSEQQHQSMPRRSCDQFFPPPPPLRPRSKLYRVRNNTGRWTFEEHNAFLRGVELYGRTYEAVASLVPTRTVLQIRTHSQKYFAKINKGEAFPEEVRTYVYRTSGGFYVAHDKGTNRTTTVGSGIVRKVTMNI